MRNLALGFLLALSVSAVAESPMVTLPMDDIEQLLFRLRVAEQESIRYDLDRARAIQILLELQRKVEMLEARKCL